MQKALQQFDRRVTLNPKGFKVYSRDVSHFDGVVEKAERLLERLRPLAKPGVCIQAGGWAGAFPVVLADYFGSVYTFEPERHNYALLKHNTSNLSNVITTSDFALWDAPCSRYLQVTRSTLSHKVLQSPGSTKCQSIDNLGLTSCSALVLSADGSEIAALRGAAETIKKYEPVVVVESKSRHDNLSDIKKELPDYVRFDSVGSKHIFVHHWQAYKLGYWDR